MAQSRLCRVTEILPDPIRRITASSPPLGLHVPLRLRVLRRPTAPQSVEGPRLLVGAPLELGEAIMYDSRP